MNKNIYIRLLMLLILLGVFSYGYAIEKETKKDDKNTTEERYYPSTQKVGYIGIFEEKPLDNPSDNVFTVYIPKLPTDEEQIWLTYELDGVSNYTGISHSINDQLAIGGFFVIQSKGWQHQEEQIKKTWLKEGNNVIRFSLPNQANYNYRIRNLGILIKKVGSQGRDIVINQSTTKEYVKNFGYINGFVQGRDSDNAQVFIDGKRVCSISSVFEQVITKQTNEKKWKTSIKVIFPDGEIIRKKIIFNNKIEAHFYNKISPRATATIIDKFTPSKELNLELEGATISIPANGLSKQQNISITALRNIDIPALDPGLVNVTKNNAAYRFLPHGLQFGIEAKISLEYDIHKIPQGYTEKDIKTYYFDEISKHWIALKKEQLATKTNSLISKTSHFTDMINGIIKVPESPQTAGFIPTSIKNIKAANPAEAINTIEPPTPNNMGSTNLSYPIIIPAGRLGLHPNLNVQYNSGGANDWMGVGWNLQIPNISIENRWGVPRYNPSLETETYSMSGEQLWPVAHRGDPQPRLAEKQFHLRVEGTFDKIIRHGTSPMIIGGK